MVGSHGFTKRLERNAIHNTFVFKITYILKNELHILPLEDSTLKYICTTLLNLTIKYKAAISLIVSNTFTPGEKI